MTLEINTPLTPTQAQAPRESGLTPTRYHPSAAVWIAIAAAGIALVLAILLVMAAPVWAWRHLGYIVGGGLCVFILTFSVFVIWWQMRMVNKPIRDLEKDHKRKVDALQLEIERLKLIPVKDQVNMLDLEKGELLELQGWRLLAFELMGRGKDDPHVTREYAQDCLGISQRAYRKLNAAFVEAGIKTENAWLEHDDLLPLLHYSSMTWDVNGGGIWINNRHVLFPRDWDK